MEQYISKSAVLAEIDKVMAEEMNFYETACKEGDEEVSSSPMVYTRLQILRSYIDTLEVKEVDLEKDVRQIFSLYYEGIKYYDDVIKEERKENGGSDLAIKILDGVIDARELGIQYVIDKLKAQKGE